MSRPGRQRLLRISDADADADPDPRSESEFETESESCRARFVSGFFSPARAEVGSNSGRAPTSSFFFSLGLTQATGSGPGRTRKREPAGRSARLGRPRLTVRKSERALGLTSASLSKRANSSLSVLTSSGAGQCEEIAVKPTMSAKRMLLGGGSSFVSVFFARQISLRILEAEVADGPSSREDPKLT